MTMALGTVFFLSIAWLTVVAMAATLEGKASRIRAALAGRPVEAIPPLTIRLSSRYPQRRAQRSVSPPRLRAAA
ncbi:hypothetical protein G7076_05855 [Sphingomonas sp. HDW15A]|uniref:hypothetical protein n=1 Tax=Sphingomonas sp. HDW15A TaxID=2714942 RepID=UPI00140C1DE6|nr:hypothetical protein [Sphingomonas sp. HDW15A]QIK96040.1 hypothetical protein G7076_05855 [Sphingomonas sp. HDW15A]